MDPKEIRKSARANLSSDGSSQIRFRVENRSQCSASCRDVIDGACKDTGGVCDFVYQCYGKESDKVNQIVPILKTHNSHMLLSCSKLNEFFNADTFIEGIFKVF